VLFEILHPPAQATGLPLDKKTKPNALSCVLRISHGRASALLAGDIEAPQELALVASGIQPVNLLLVPHHGSKTSSTGPFIEALKPQVAVVQAGYRNRYGHPAEPVVQRYKGMGIELVENTRCGAARWVSSEPQRVHCERALSRRYWHHTVAP
jgi:competence protein ComEC